MHTCLLIILLKVSKTTEMQLLTGSPIAPQPPVSASPPPNRPFLLHRTPRVLTAPRGAVPPTLGTNTCMQACGNTS